MWVDRDPAQATHIGKILLKGYKMTIDPDPVDKAMESLEALDLPMRAVQAAIDHLASLDDTATDDTIAAAMLKLEQAMKQVEAKTAVAVDDIRQAKRSF